MIYRSRIEPNITVDYDGGRKVSIVSVDDDGNTTTIVVENIGALIQSLHDVQRLKYDSW